MDYVSSFGDPSQAPAAATPPSEERPRKIPWYSWRRLGLNFLTFSILGHLIFGIIAAYFIVQVIQPKRKNSFGGGSGGPAAPARAMEHQVQMKKTQAMSAPRNAKRVTTTGITKVSLPVMPSMKVDAPVMPSVMSGMGGRGNLGMGGGGGGGNGNGSGNGFGTGKGISPFGFRTGGGLVGRLYDLKQDRNRRPTPMTPESYQQFIVKFIQGGFNQGMLNPYYQASVPLYTTQIFTPAIEAVEAPKAFGVEKEVQPRMWLALYKGKVIPNESGTYRFMGFGDDVLVVKLNGKTVLDRGYITGGQIRSNHIYRYKFDSGDWYASEAHTGGHGEGLPMEMEAGKSYDLQVLLGEWPGGICMFQLMIQKDGVDYEKTPEGAPILPVFRVGPGELPAASNQFPPFAKNGPIWRAEKLPAGL